MKRSAILLFALCLLFSAAFAQKELSIAAVQGNGNSSPHVGEAVTVSGIITARTRTGFYLQTPDDKADQDSATSEGIFIYTRNEPPADAAVGDLVSVSGKVAEFRPRNELSGLESTQISHFLNKDQFKVVTKQAGLPKPITLTFQDFKPNSYDQLEKYEGMRVTVADLVVVAPSGGRVDPKAETVSPDGVFYGVLKGTPRPFREPGVEALDLMAAVDRERWQKDVPRLPTFDGNPEVLRIDTVQQTGSTRLAVTTKAELKNVTGVVGYAFGRFAILTDPGQIAVTGLIKPVPLPAPTERQFSVASANIETLVDDVDDPGIKEDIATKDAFQKRIGKISLAVRTYLGNPDVFAVVEAENLNVLKQLAARINADSVAAGKPDPRYEAFLFDGNDARGIDCGFLVKTANVTVVEAKQLGKDDKYKNPVTDNQDTLNDRTPIMIRVQIRPKNGEAFPLTVVANHLKSFRGSDDPKDGPNVRMKKKLQAEFIAKWVNERQKADPTERILLVGDFNAFQFSDGLVDQIGTIKGKPAPKDAVVLASDDLVETDLINLVDLINPDQQYSYSFDGNAQVLDHFIANAVLRKYLVGFGYLRVNADYPQNLRADGSRVERFSDHDVAVGYFNFELPKTPR